MIQCKNSWTPLPLAHYMYEEQVPTTDLEKLKIKTIPNRNILGRLLYLANRIQLDNLSVPISILEKFQNGPTPFHWNWLKHFVPVWKGTVKFGLMFPIGKSTKDLVENCHADWGRDLEKRGFRTFYVVYFKSAPVLWKSKLQFSTATSTFEA